MSMGMPAMASTSPRRVGLRWPCRASMVICGSVNLGYAPYRSGVSAAPPPSRFRCSDISFVDIAPTPVLARLQGPHDGVTDGERVRTGVPQRRRVATADVATRQAHPQMHPR